MTYKKITLLNGTLIVPEDFISLEETITPSANYAGVVAEKNGTLPHFIFLSEKPISEFTVKDEEHIYSICEGVCPDVKNIRKNEISAEMDSQGNILNAEDYLKAPRLGIFVVKEVEDENELYLNTGIIRMGV